MVHTSVRLGDAEVHALLGAIPLDPDLSLLTSTELAAAGRMTPGRRAEFAFGRSLLRRAAALVLQRPVRELTPAEDTDGGPPRFAQAPELGTSVSHSGGMAAVAVCMGSSVGIDIEPVTGPKAATLRRWASLPSYRGLAELDGTEQARRFTRTWTVQEACAKAVGAGLSARPWQIPVDAVKDRGAWGTVRWMRLDSRQDLALAVATAPAGAHDREYAW
ncbi:4'-phosphopantetheinyl transferase superfamily protein [Streptomyces sp. NBC_01408]|uniref:4'-phosphopantetheinyl transferase family protein n=1 Tax=Streptomyces sp. NBC_01408 TaxID=2903855 RepID=UPI002251E4B5|nr:4'-phosphopantetheinyl transferase superfamily protein [Streptomyces sp. NBC_01408]MCX4694699.1 4'-phosphopantetheinyl transferase superfamily protein [Streptomyces sp. NBC_01408]